MIENIEEKKTKIYHVETQQAYDELMSELEEKGCEWRDGEKLTDIDEFSTHGKDTYVYEERCDISISSGDYFKKYHRNETLIEYKAKGETIEIEKILTKAIETAYSKQSEEVSKKLGAIEDVAQSAIDGIDYNEVDGMTEKEVYNFYYGWALGYIASML